MDNLCHTLAGAALGRAGLERRTPLATATLLIGANLPDVDVIAYAWGSEAALAFRRGWTHGVLALAIWPFVLAGLMLAWDRFVRRRRHPGAAPARGRELLLLSTVAVLSHPILDHLNTYGMRWLMPFRDVWFYGDTLFIVDVWLWLVLGLGVFGTWLLLRRGSAHARRPARVALALAGVYVLAMGGSQLAARAAAREALPGGGLGTGSRLMAGPLPVTPLRRVVVAEQGERYLLGTVDWLGRPRFQPGEPAVLEKNAGHPAVAAAARTREGAIFLHWARFPFFRVEESGDGWTVWMTDARYATEPGDEGFARERIEVRRSEVASHPAERGTAPVPRIP